MPAAYAFLTPLRLASRSTMLRVVVRRLLMAIPLLFIVSTITFVLVALTPGDAARSILGIEAPQEEYAKLRQALGLDQPVYQQYWNWLKHAVQGDLGTSLVSGEPVRVAIENRLSVTASLIVGALLVTMFIGVGIGILSAVRGGIVARAVDSLALIGFSLPSFWIGAFLIGVFAVDLGWLPATGYVRPSDSMRGWLLALVLPVTALTIHSVAAVAKQTREAMLDALSSEYVRMAWASGLPKWRVVFRHALRNAAIPVVTVLGVLFVGLLGGTVLVEQVFALPGLGGLAVNASTQHDLPVIQGLVVYFTVIVVIVNLVIDVTYTLLNPRVRAR
jgi:peptide/nickel transport system permease protein